MALTSILLLLQVMPSCPTEGWRTSPYGNRRDPITKRWKRHTGLDIGAPKGTSVRNMWAGKVVRTRSMRREYGNYVVVQSGEHRVLYAHLNKILVERGSEVDAGSLVGKIGDSGRATGPHLHLEIRKRGHRVDPDHYLGHCPDLP